MPHSFFIYVLLIVHGTWFDKSAHKNHLNNNTGKILHVSIEQYPDVPSKETIFCFAKYCTLQESEAC